MLDFSAVDFNPGIDRNKYEAVVHKVEEFVVKRFLSRYPTSSKTTPFVHIIKVKPALRNLLLLFASSGLLNIIHANLFIPS
jgi:hypothetical protein